MNILYPDFLARFLVRSNNPSERIELTGENARSFKLALIQMDPTDEDCELGRTDNRYINEDGSQGWGNFRYLQSIGAEVSSNGTGYEAGGLPLKFNGPHIEIKDKIDYTYFDCNALFTWGSESAPVNFTTYAACIYVDGGEGGEYDGLMVAWYEFPDPQVIIDGSFTFSFNKSHPILIKQNLYQVYEDASIPTDDTLNTDSDNPISNRAVTNALINLGTHLGLGIGDQEQNLDVFRDAIENPGGELDTIEAMSKARILDIFNNIIHPSDGD